MIAQYLAFLLRGNIVNDKPGRTGPMHLSSQAVLRWPFKLVTGPAGPRPGPASAPPPPSTLMDSPCPVKASR